MNIHLVGFEWRLPGTVPTADFLYHIATVGRAERIFKGYTRLLPTDRTDGYFTGVFLTIKDQSKVTAIDLRSHVVSVEELAAGKNLVDFNFFAANKTAKNTIKGIYQHYFHSPTVSTFNQYIQHLYSLLRADLVLKEGGDGSGPGGKKKREAAETKFPPEIAADALIRQEALPALLAELSRIKYCEMNIAVSTANERLFYPDYEAVNSQRIRVAFKPGVDQGSTRKNIIQYIKDLRSNSGRVVGMDEGGVERIVNIISNPDIFGTYDFNDVVSKGFIDSSSPSKSPFLGTIVKEMKDHTGVFGPAPKKES